MSAKQEVKWEIHFSVEDQGSLLEDGVRKKKKFPHIALALYTLFLRTVKEDRN